MSASSAAKDPKLDVIFEHQVVSFWYLLAPGFSLEHFATGLGWMQHFYASAMQSGCLLLEQRKNETAVTLQDHKSCFHAGIDFGPN